MDNNKVFVVGAGISGISACYFLKKRGVKPILIERSSNIGGRAGYEQIGDTMFEVGGKNFNLGGDLSREFLNAHQITEFDNQHTRFPFVVNGRLFILGKHNEAIGRTLYSLLRNSGIRGCYQFLRFITFIGQNKNNLKYGSELMASIEDQFDHHHLSHHFCQPLAYNVLRGFTIILCGAEPEEICYSTLTAALANQQGASVSIRGGIGRLFQKASKDCDVRLNTTVEKIVIQDNRVTGLIVNNGQMNQFMPAQSVVLSVPCHILKKIIDLPDTIVQTIDRIKYSPLTMVVAKYSEDVFNNKINSIFFDRHYYLGHVSANREYEKNIVRYTFSGKKGRTVLGKNDEALVSIAEKELSSIPKAVKKAPSKAKRLAYKVYRYEKGVCAYGPHFSRARQQLVDYFSSIQGLSLSGDFLEGHNMENCLQASKSAVDRLTAQMYA